MTKKQKTSSAAKEYLRSFYAHNHIAFVAGLCLSLLDIPVTLGLAWGLGEVLDTIAGADLARLGRLLIVTLSVIVLAGAVSIVRGQVKSVFVHRGLRQYKTLAFQKLSEKSISAFARENTGRYLSVLTNDVNTLEESYLYRLFDMVYLTIQFVCTLLFMLWYSPVMTGATVLLCVLPMVGAMLFSPEMNRRETAVSDGNERFVARLKDLLSGFAVLKSFKAEQEAQMLFDEENRRIEHQKMRRRWWRSLLEGVSYYFFGPLMQLGIFFIGAYLAIRGSITLGTTVVFIQTCNYLLMFVQQVPQQYAARKAARGLIEKLAEVTQENAEHSGEVIQPVLRESIALAHVTFGYNADTPVLKDLSLTLKAGRKYALVGASGSGKSTLVNLLMGAFDEYEGSITIDGKELRTVDPDSLYDMISLIGQNVFLFDDTVQRNITMFKEFPANQVQAAVERSGLTAFIEERGEGYRCGENGVGLSGGERQRISIARALLRGTPVLLLDEATASLDNQTAYAVTDSILHLEGLTRLVVTHRLEAGLLAQYDEIFVLKDGVLRERGGFAELMEKKGLFYSLYTVAQ